MGRSAIADEVSWRTILHQAAGPVAMLDHQACFVYVNPAMCRMLGYDADHLLGCTPSEITHPDDPAVDSAVIERLAAGPEASFDVEKRFLRADGSVLWVLLTNSIIRGQDGRSIFLLSQIHDVSARRAAALLWQRTLANAPIGMALLDLAGRWTEVNDKLCELVGYSREELLNRHFTDLTYPDDRDEGMDTLAELLAGRRNVMSFEKRYRHKSGYPFWMLIRTSVVPDLNGRPDYLVSQYETIGGQQMRESHLAHLALHDPLTGLANRTLLADRFKQALTELSSGNEVLAILLVDLDGMKPVNDTYGHVVGDQLLTTVADELLNTVRAGDTVARLGGDEFVVLTRVADFAAAEALRDRVSACLRTDLTAAGHSLSLSASVGLTTTQNPATTAEALLGCADRDMYRRKTPSR